MRFTVALTQNLRTYFFFKAESAQPLSKEETNVLRQGYFVLLQTFPAFGRVFKTKQKQSRSKKNGGRVQNGGKTNLFHTR